MKKIIGLSTGRKNGNCEILLKEAAKGAAELGVETEIIRAMDLRVLPCKGCFACHFTQKCVLDDDVDWILKKTCVEDTGLIVASPCYHLRANAYLMAIAERLNHIFMKEGGDCSIFKKTRVGGIISVGNSDKDWTTLNLLTINLFVQHTRFLVDQMEANFAMEKGAVLRLDKSMQRARLLGRNVASAMMKPIDEVKFVGEDSPIYCPSCHCNVLFVPANLPHVTCPVCWVHGEIVVNNGQWQIVWNKDDVINNRFSPYGEKLHLDFAEKRFEEDRQFLKTDKAKKLLQEYSAYGKIIHP
ncbi:MAG: flavodoxin family protein [Dehalococcoidales bacterium]|nr:flavodoxin family protein [Dehalococcoidales bacterium]